MLLDWLIPAHSPLHDRRVKSSDGRPALSLRRLCFEPLEERLTLTIVAGGNGTQNTTAPLDDPGFANVGSRAGASAVYLGDGWVLTATHVGGGPTYFNNILYDVVPNSAVQLTNPTGVGYTPYTDLTLYQLIGRPDLPSVSIESLAPAVGWNVIMIGRGRDRAPDLTYWNSSWAVQSGPSTYSGYLWSSSQSMRWATNVISYVGLTRGVNTNSEASFATTFTGNTPYDGQGATGDSGGGVFHKDADGSWQLAGIMFSISLNVGQPASTAAFGNMTYIADLSAYRNQILTVINANHAPSGASQTVTTLQGTPYTFAVSDFGFSDPADTPADQLQAVKITTLPSQGVLTDNGVPVIVGQIVSVADISANKLQFTAAPGGTGVAYAAFTFQVKDNGGTAGGGVDLDPVPKTMTISVTPVDTTPPTVQAVAPLSALTNVPVSSQVTVTFSEAVNVASLSAATIQLRDSNGNLVTANVAYSTATNTATLAPAGPLANSSLYSITVVGGVSGVKDLNGNALAANFVSTFTTIAAVNPTFSLWPANPVPATIDSGDSQSVELGVKFTANSSGYITGIRYYKSAANVGVHIGNLWSGSGQLLATATFTGEGSSGWQQVNFSTPVAITAGATYVASYHTNSGRYAVNKSYFASSYTNGPLQVPAGGGVYAYGAGSFPTATYQGSNYWVDVVFTTTPPADNTPPTVTAVSPAGNTANVATSASVVVTFSEALSSATVNSSTLLLRDANNNLVAATVSYNASSKSATLTPNSPLENSTTYTVTVVGGSSGVKDLAGNALSTNFVSSFSTSAPQSPTSSLWSPSVTPSVADSGDGQGVELGVKFSASTNGFITGIRYYKSALNGGTHVGSLWSSTGQLLATATFTNESSSGWQQVTFATPVAITAGATYVASYYTSLGHYAVSKGYFSAPYSNGSLQVSPGGGVYAYGRGGLPTQSYLSSNYWVDVVFTTVPPADNTPPTMVSISPAGSATGVATNAAITITFSEALNAATVTAGTIVLRDANNNVVPTAIAYNVANRTVTLTPSGALANSTTYTLTVAGSANGVKDLAGNALGANVASSFTTIAALGPTASLWSNSATPAIADSGDGQAIELGVRFTATVNGFVTGITFYKSAANTGIHTGSLWTASGTLLATGTFVNETASGWQQLIFSTPVAIAAGTTYVASYHTTAGHYATTRSYFGSPFTSGQLKVPVASGVYSYGAGGFPTQSYQSSNYWVDVLFSAG